MATTHAPLMLEKHTFEKPSLKLEAPSNPFYLYLQTRHMSSTARRRHGERRRRGIRTGCISCLAKGVRCDQTNPACVRRVSTKWKSDIVLAVDSTKAVVPSPRPPDQASLAIPSLDIDQLSFTSPTVRMDERQGLHFFIDYTAPQLAGSFGSTFWQEMVIRAAYHNRVILHALIGMGSLHEAIVHSRSQAELHLHKRYAFALRHINYAIKHARSDTEDSSKNLASIQTLCIVLTTFEAMQGQTKSAIQHAFQGIKLLMPARNREHLSNVESVTLDTTMQNEDNSFPVSKATISSIFNYFTSVATLFSTDLSPVVFCSPSDLPTRFSSLQEAEQLLRDARSTIMMLFLLTCRLPNQVSRLQAANRMRNYQPWVDNWKAALDTFLATPHDPLSTTEQQQLLILQANHIFCHISVNVEYAGLSTSSITDRYRRFNSLLTRIVDICEDLVSRVSPPTTPIVLSEKNTYLSYGMWILEPLYMAANYSTDTETKRRAAKILRDQPRPEPLAHSGPFAGGKDILAEAKEKSFTSSEQRRKSSGASR
ncbi:hypothetical protein BDZ85DRAFT_9394 [Elsinoe ampelina]|uniref:Zn(2)-C6 fungal-type domain-containing protein n=1 Tax=Elsinoe ampelina TaxID=302913 RepID=A0A6A6GQ90_9PEZI|nr:hypothetical protein BDZ85DRAFT_9394 [Elsinoe ampelina]